MIHEIITTKNVDGRGNRNQFSNRYYIQTTQEFNAAPVIALAASIVAAEKAASMNYVHFMQTTIKHVLDDNHALGSQRFKSIDETGTGAVLEDGSRLPEDIALIVKREADEGRAGHLEYRHMAQVADAEQDIKGNWELGPTKKTNLGFDGNAPATIIQVLNNPPAGFEYVIPQPVKSQELPARIITAHKYGGMKSLQITRRRKSIETDEVRLAQRKLNAFGRKLRSIYERAQDGLLSGTLLSSAQQLFDAAMTFLTGLNPLIRALLNIPRFLAGARPA